MHKDKEEIIKILLSELKDVSLNCYNGTCKILVNCLSGFDEDVQIQISQNEQIGNVLSQLSKIYTDELTFKLKATLQLQELGYSESIINEWLISY